MFLKHGSAQITDHMVLLTAWAGRDLAQHDASFRVCSLTHETVIQ
jgi:hypothetical protein